MRRHVEGCGCLDCRTVEAATLQRPFLDAAAWAVGLCRSYPSIPVLGVVLAFAGQATEVAGPQYLPAPLVGPLEQAASLALFFGLRAYVASVAASELAGDGTAPRSRLRASVWRLPALGVVLVAALFVALTVPSAVLTVANIPFFLAGVSPLRIVGAEVVVAVVLVVHLLPVVVLLFKTWFGLEACVVGGYGPVRSLRVSWGLATNHRGRLLGLIAGNLGSLGLVGVVGGLGGVGGVVATVSPLVTPVVAGLTQATVVVWYGIYAHYYVQSVVESS